MSPSTNSNIVHVVFAADANYVMPLAVAMCSVAIHCDKKRELVFTVIQSGIVHDLRAKVESSVAKTGFPDAKITWLDAPIERIADFKLAHRYTTCLTFARLLIAELLPVTAAKAIYLDCDIVVNEDIGELWDIDLEGKSLFAVRDSIGVVSHPGGLLNYRELGIPAGAHYFNAGVLLMNLKKWRECKINERLFRYLWDHHAVIQKADQEALNAVLWDDWGEMDYRWNWQIVWRRYRLGIATREWVPEDTRKSIVHFITAEKPWLPGCDYPEKTYFFKYLDKTEWAGVRVPWWVEIYGRSLRAIGDIRNALGMWRRRVTNILARTVNVDLLRSR